MLNKVLITGGGGYVGALLVPKLLGLGYCVKVIDWMIYDDHIFKNLKSNPQLKLIIQDIRDKTTLDKELVGIDAVIHLACISNDPSFDLDPRLGKSINYDATRALINLSVRHKIKRFIYASSSSVYGIKKEKEVTEDLPLCPLTDYSKYKALCEKYLLEKQTRDFCVMIARPSTVCGYSSRMRLDLTVNMLTIQAIVNKEITVFGGKQMRPNIHIKDMVDFYVNSLRWPAKKISGRIYNVGYENYSVMQIAQMIKKTLKIPGIKIKTVPTNDLRSYHVSSQKIKRELGFTAKHAVSEAINDIYKAYKKGLIKNPMTDKKYYNMKTMRDMKDA